MANLQALELAVEFYELSKTVGMPYYLREQFLRASSSVALNLAEGSAKPTSRDRHKFYHIALGSLRECQTILRLHGLTNSPSFKLADRLGACLYSLCKSPHISSVKSMT